MSSYNRRGGPVPPCFICLEQHRSWHSHHVTMRAKTGELGPQVVLCGSCHTGIHAVATARVAKLRGGNPNPKNLEWSYSRHNKEVENAEALIQPLVKVMLLTDGADLPKVTSLQLPVDINNGLMKLKKDLGVTSKTAAILYCCASVLAARGLLNTRSTTNTRLSPKGVKARSSRRGSNES